MAELQRREQNKLAEERQKELLLGLKSEEEKLEKVRAKKTAKRRAKKVRAQKAKGAKCFKNQESKLRDSLEQVVRTSQQHACIASQVCVCSCTVFRNNCSAARAILPHGRFTDCRSRSALSTV